MMHSFPVYVIHRQNDEVRANWVTDQYKKQGIAFEFINALDGHGDISVFAPYSSLIGTHFWGESWIKPGALACYISHMRAWEKLLESNHKFALIAEDDSAPRSSIETLPIDEIVNQELDIVFMNDRLSSLASEPISKLEPDGFNRLFNQGFSKRAPGGDGYFLTRTGAQKLRDFTQKQKIVCGIDWAILFSCFDGRNRKHKDIKSIPELKKLWKLSGAMAPTLNGGALKNPFFINESFPSTLVHKEKIEIEQLAKLNLSHFSG